jgi:inorganic pyrophosphatase
MEDDKGIDEKILCVPKSDPLWNYIETIEQVPPHLLKEITHFFETYKNLENKHVIIIGWEGLKTATNILQEAKSIYVEQNEIADGHSALNKLSDSY